MKNVQVNTDGLQFDNANGTHTNVNTSATADTYINLPSSSGTLALTSQVGSAPLLARQTGDTSVTNSSVLVDTYLTVSAAANTTYAVEMFLNWSSSGALTTQQVFISAPSGATGQTIQSAGASTNGVPPTDISSATMLGGVSSSNAVGYMLWGQITTTNAGTIKIQMAHEPGNETAATLKLLTGSWMRLTAIA